MDSVFVSTTAVQSQRWRSAQPNAQVCLDCAPEQLPLTPNTLVWLVMVGPWRECLAAALAAKAKVVAMTLSEDVQQARQVIALGASGYVHAWAAPELLKQVKSAVEYDGLWLGKPLLNELLMLSASAKAQPKPVSDQLSMREHMVAQAVAEGKNNKEIARELNITERTVKAHLSACFDKLNVRNRMQLALLLNRQQA